MSKGLRQGEMPHIAVLHRQAIALARQAGVAQG